MDSTDLSYKQKKNGDNYQIMNCSYSISYKFLEYSLKCAKRIPMLPYDKSAWFIYFILFISVAYFVFNTKPLSFYIKSSSLCT